MITVAQAIARGREQLVAGGVPPAEAPGDAEVLARHVLDWDLTRLAVSLKDDFPADRHAQYQTLLARRLKREPVSQIVGHREFWGLDFEVTRDVLTPRPETELVVQAAIDSWPSRTGSVVIDVGTGSGCIAVALATELKEARIIASDASRAALSVARRNAARHGVSERIAFVCTDSVPPEKNADMIVANPPYIPLTQRDTLAPEVREYEPEIALFGGHDGLDIYRALFRPLSGALNVGGWLIVEVGYDQAGAVRALADPRLWQAGRSYRDLQGIERVLTFRLIHPNPTADREDGEE